MLEIITPRPPATGKQRANADQDAESSTASANAAPATHLEAPTKIRYPTKRMTIGEMRKRVRNLLEFVGRVQGEEDKRAERARLLGLNGQLPRDDVEEPKETEAAKDENQDIPAADETMEVGAAAGDEVKTSETEPETEVKAQSEAVPAENGDAEATPMDVDSNGTAGEKATEDITEPMEKATDPTSSAPQETSLDQTPAEPTKPTVPDEPAGPSVPSEDPAANTPSVPPPTQSQPPAAVPQPSKSSQLLADLTSDLIRFQMMFEVGGSVFAAPAGNAGEDV